MSTEPVVVQVSEEQQAWLVDAFDKRYGEPDWLSDIERGILKAVRDGLPAETVQP